LIFRRLFESIQWDMKWKFYLVPSFIFIAQIFSISCECVRPYIAAAAVWNIIKLHNNKMSWKCCRKKHIELIWQFSWFFLLWKKCEKRIFNKKWHARKEIQKKRCMKRKKYNNNSESDAGCKLFIPNIIIVVIVVISI
jgi:hypothetical protein